MITCELGPNQTTEKAWLPSTPKPNCEFYYYQMPMQT